MRDAAVDVTELVALAQNALLLSVALALPVLGVAALVGLVTGLLQTATRLADPALAHLPRLVAVAAVLAVLGPWMGTEVVAFAARAFGAP